MRLYDILPHPNLYKKYSSQNNLNHSGKSYNEIDAYLISLKEKYQPEDLDFIVKQYANKEFRTPLECYQTLYGTKESEYTHALNKLDNIPYITAILYAKNYVEESQTMGVLFGEPATWDIIATISLSAHDKDFKVGYYLSPELLYSAKNFITFWHNQSRMPLIKNSSGEWLIDTPEQAVYGVYSPELTISNLSDRNVGENLTRMTWQTIRNLTNVALTWCKQENKILTYDEYVHIIRKHAEHMDPAALYAMIAAGVSEGYNDFQALPTGIINIIYK